MAPQRTGSWPLAVLAMQLACGFAAETIYSYVPTGVGWAENLTLQNLEAETARPAVLSLKPYCAEKDPVILCTQNCLHRLEFCSSFSYVATATHCICKLYKSPHFLIENMSAKEGSRFFYAIDVKCPVQDGYRLLHFEHKRNLCLLYLGTMTVSSDMAKDKCGAHGGVLPKLTNKYVTDVILEFVRANSKGKYIMIQAGARKIDDDVWLWELDGTPISLKPRSSSEDSPHDLSYWDHTFWHIFPERLDFRQDCMYADEGGWFVDHCDSMEQDVVCQYGPLGQGQDLALQQQQAVSGLAAGEVLVAGAVLAGSTAAPWLITMALWMSVCLGR